MASVVTSRGRRCPMPRMASAQQGFDRIDRAMRETGGPSETPETYQAAIEGSRSHLYLDCLRVGLRHRPAPFHALITALDQRKATLEAEGVVRLAPQELKQLISMCETADSLARAAALRQEIEGAYGALTVGANRILERCLRELALRQSALEAVAIPEQDDGSEDSS